MILVGGGIEVRVQISCSWPFWSSMSLRATLKGVRLPWLSSLASQNGATGGMTPNLQQVQFDEVYLHTAPGAVHRETHHDCAKWVPHGSDSERLGCSLAAEASAKIIQRSVTTTSAAAQGAPARDLVCGQKTRNVLLLERHSLIGCGALASNTS